MKSICRIPVLVFVAFLAQPAWAQGGFPAGPVRITVPYSASGGADGTARAFAQKLGDAWKQSMLVENKPGASGMIGADTVAKAAPVGHMLLLSSPAEVAPNQNLYSRMSYNLERGLAPISLVAITFQGSEPVGNTPEEFRAFLKAETANYGRIIREVKVKLK